jgi:predicted transcriptional regulator
LRKTEGKPEKKDDDLDEALADIDPVEEWKKTAKELEDAQRVIESLSQTDHGAELKRQIEARKVAEHRLSDEMTRCAKLDKEIRQYGKWFRELREIAGVETRSEITRILRDGVQSLKETVAL